MVTRGKYFLSVFINCPFDSAYKPIFEAIVFAIFDCGFIPRCALEENDSDTIRIEKILKIILECQYGIHDISRSGVDAKTNLARFNMPFELGLFLGCKKFGKKEHNGKSCLILDTDRFRYRDFISDISGQDIRGHNDSPEESLKQVRDYLASKTSRKTIPSSNLTWERFKKFATELPKYAAELKWDYQSLSFMEYQYLIKGWLKVNAA
jgi:hypothetical protein